MVSCLLLAVNCSSSSAFPPSFLFFPLLLSHLSSLLFSSFLFSSPPFPPSPFLLPSLLPPILLFYFSFLDPLTSFSLLPSSLLLFPPPQPLPSSLSPPSPPPSLLSFFILLFCTFPSRPFPRHNKSNVIIRRGVRCEILNSERITICALQQTAAEPDLPSREPCQLKQLRPC